MKVRPLWGKEVKEHRKIHTRPGIKIKLKPSVHTRYAEKRKSAALTVEKSKTWSWKDFGHNSDFNYWMFN